jgi:hypothetical protein
MPKHTKRRGKKDVPLGIIMLVLLGILILYIFKFSMGPASAAP